MRRIILAIALIAAAAPAFAVQPDEMLKDPALEARARAISAEMRCLVCQNQSIDDSDSSLARDLRVLIRERLTAGDSDAAVKEFLVSRYGDFVLLKPPLKAGTLVLWLGPFAILLAGLAGLLLNIRRKQPAPPGEAPLTDDERARLERSMDASSGEGRA